MTAGMSTFRESKMAIQERASESTEQRAPAKDRDDAPPRPEFHYCFNARGEPCKHQEGILPASPTMPASGATVVCKESGHSERRTAAQAAACLYGLLARI
jgi:hypothetical protein